MNRAMILFTSLFIMIGTTMFFITAEETELVTGDALLEGLEIESIDTFRVERHNLNGEVRYEQAFLENEENQETILDLIEQSKLKPIQGDVHVFDYIIYLESGHRPLSIRLSEDYITAGSSNQSYQFEEDQTLIETIESLDLTWESPKNEQN